jgi:hypothetical protein
MGGIRKIEIVAVDTERDDGIAMALLAAAQDLAEVKERIQNLVNAHAMRLGVSLATE